jgi:hypothetical protein
VRHGRDLRGSVPGCERRILRPAPEARQGTSELLPVGSHRLFTAGKTQAAQSIPFEIRAGTPTKVDVRVRAGVRQRFDIELPATRS